jgi:hypothetical protein
METAVAPKITNRFAIISLIAISGSVGLALFAFLGGYFHLSIDYFGIVGSILNLLEFLLPLTALIIGVVALRQIKVRAEKGKVLALIGVFFGGLIVALQVLFYVNYLLGRS